DEEPTGQMAFPEEDTSREEADSVEDDELEKGTISDMIKHENEAYELPSMNNLNDPVKQTQQREKSQIQKIVRVLEQTFESFGVKAKVTKAHVGPAVTKYEVYPDAGVKVSRILNLQDDLALALAAQDIRIEAPIPGKSAVGI